jgi:uncharacterized protein
VIIDCHAHWAIDWEKKYHGDPSHWLEYMDRHGVTASVMMGQMNMVRQDLSSQDNDTLAKMGRQFPKRILPLATTWPQLGDVAVNEVVRCLDQLKVKGLKFHPWRQGFSLTDPTFAKICGLAGELKAPVFLHDGTPCYSLPEQVGALAARVRDVEAATGALVASMDLTWLDGLPLP